MLILKVPYAEKDEAKALGARWNNERKVWYIPEGKSPDAFKRWAPMDGGSKGPGAASTAPSAKPGQVNAMSAKPVTGAHYVELDHDCNPFEACAQCAPVLAQSGWSATREQVRQMLASRP